MCDQEAPQAAAQLRLDPKLGATPEGLALLYRRGATLAEIAWAIGSSIIITVAALAHAHETRNRRRW